MTEEQFRRHMADYGADPSRWPPELRAAAEGTLAASPALRAAMAKAGAFDRLLAGTSPQVGEDRVARLLASVTAAARAKPQETLALLLLGPMPRRVAASLCVALVALGWLAGSLALPQAPPLRTRDVALLNDEVTILFDGDQR